MLDQFKVEYNFYFLLEQHNRLRNRSHVINQGKSIFDRSCVCTIEPIIDYDFFRQLNTLLTTNQKENLLLIEIIDTTVLHNHNELKLIINKTL